MSNSTNGKPAVKGGIKGRIITEEVFKPDPIQVHEGKKAPKWLIWGLVVVLLIIGIIVVDFVFDLAYKLSVKVDQDLTPISPFLILTVCVGGLVWFGSIWIPKNVGKDRRLYYAWWILGATIVYTCYFHSITWVGGFTLGIVQFLVLRMLKGVLLMIKGVIRLDIAVLIVIFLTDSFIATIIYFLNIPTSWYVIIGTVSTFNSSFWLMYCIWMRLPKQKEMERNKK